jgi:hypothetical protein
MAGAFLSCFWGWRRVWRAVAIGGIGVGAGFGLFSLLFSPDPVFFLAY